MIQAHDGRSVQRRWHALLTADALKLLEQVSDEIEGYCEQQFGLDEEGEEVEWTEETVSAEEIRREVLQVLYYVYGRLPW